MPGKAYASLQNPAQYEDLKAKGFSKQSAARISNASAPGHTVAAHARNGKAIQKHTRKRHNKAALKKALGA